MRRLKRKHQMAIVFALYFFSFLVVFLFLILAIFQFIMFHQIKSDLTHEVFEIKENHIGEENGSLLFLKDKQGESLRQHLSNDNISAIFFDSDMSIIRKYGVFEWNNPSEDKQMLIIKDITSTTLRNLISVEKELNWNNGKYYLYVLPITKSNKLIGAMVLVKSLDTIDKTVNSMLLILLPLGIVGFVGSLGLGFYLSNRAFAPIGYIASQIEKIDLERLDKIIHIAGNTNDELVMLSEKFNRMIERVKEMSRRQKEFVSNASHELKTPLTKAVSTLDIISTNEPDTLADIKKVKGDLLDLNGLLDNLMLLSKLKETSNVPQGSSNIRSVYAKAKKILLGDTKRKKIRFREKLTDFDVDIPQEYLEIILVNIIGNAVKYSKMNSWIDIKILNENNKGIVSVEDHGYGFEIEEAEMMFNRYYRSGKTRKLEKGYGIGLPLVKELCDLYKVKIDLKSTPGKGTTFKLFFNTLV